MPEGLLQVSRVHPEDRVAALAGNPNVGKSTVFNALTGLRQHTGNWAGKTVSNAQGYCTFRGHGYVLVDLPGCYSLMSHSAEEEAARDFLCFGGADAVVVVCDATCLERNLNLVLQTIELQPRTVVCVNLMDEAKRRGVAVDLEELHLLLGVPVVGTSARSRRGLDHLMASLAQVIEAGAPEPNCVVYPDAVETAVAKLVPILRADCPPQIPPRWLALRLIDGDDSIRAALRTHLGITLAEEEAVDAALEGFDRASLCDQIVSAVVRHAERVAAVSVRSMQEKYSRRDQRLDRILTGKLTGFPIMLLMLLVIFWLTISGANYPSALLAEGLFALGEVLRSLCTALVLPGRLISLLIDGAYKTLAWVVSVMLPPMAIFFPLFTLLEDLGYLPRVAFNLDHAFRKCSACGKQALTMCMGFGCNAAGVVGARIIDSPRERLLAIITNNFVPCNGRYPTLIAIISMFFVAASGLFGSVLSAALLVLVILLGVGMTFLVCKLLSKTILKGVPSSFTLELPPYRRPQIGKVIVRSVLDRTLFVLGRAAAVALPAGVLIWVMANVTVGERTLLMHCAGFLDPFAGLLGLDGVILLAFILGLPANEIVVPIILMAYLAQGSLTEMADYASLHALLVANGWTWVTALCTMLFSLFHWPCSTTLMTIKKETQSLKWTVASFLIPTGCGVALCMAVNAVAALFGA
ncbi:MAG: ferrous iron transport protein B [Acutalibacteraceae bacterium]